MPMGQASSRGARPASTFVETLECISRLVKRNDHDEVREFGRFVERGSLTTKAPYEDIREDEDKEEDGGSHEP